jgi:hypothetical protein
MMGFGVGELVILGVICAVIGGGFIGLAAVLWVVMRKKPD